MSIDKKEVKMTAAEKLLQKSIEEERIAITSVVKEQFADMKMQFASYDPTKLTNEHNLTPWQESKLLEQKASIPDVIDKAEALVLACLNLNEDIALTMIRVFTCSIYHPQDAELLSSIADSIISGRLCDTCPFREACDSLDVIPEMEQMDICAYEGKQMFIESDEERSERFVQGLQSRVREVEDA